MSGIGEEDSATAGGVGRSANATRSVERVGEILRLLADRGEQRASELALAMQISRRAVSELLRALVTTGMVQLDLETERYSLGPELVHLGSRYLRGNELRAVAAKWARLLAVETDHVVQVGTLHGLDVLIVNHVGQLQDDSYASDIGYLHPAERTAIGKVLLAYRRDDILDHANRSTASSNGNEAMLLDELSQVRDQGWSIAEDRPASIASIACPIYERTGRVCGAIGIMGPPTDLLRQGDPQAALLERVRAASTSISRVMGASSW